MGIVKALEMDGLDCRVLFKQLGLDYTALDDPDARFPQDSMTRLWQRAVELSGNPAIGLNMGKVVRPASFHVAGYALMSSNTLAEGFQRLVRYQRIIAESADLSFRLLDEGYALILTVHGDHLPPTRQSAEASLACALGLCGWLTGRTLHPVKVLVQGAEPDDLEPYKQAFHAPLMFNAPYDALIFERADMEAPLPTANEAMALLHDRFAGEYLARFFCFAIKQPQFDCRSQCRIRDPLSCRGGVDATRRSLPGQGVNRGTHRNSCASGHVLRYRHNNLGLGSGRTLDCLSVYWDRHLRIWCDGCGPGAQQSGVSLKPTRGAGNYFCAAGRWFLRRQFLGPR